jgi:hypothetical protein
VPGGRPGGPLDLGLTSIRPAAAARGGRPRVGGELGPGESLFLW